MFCPFSTLSFLVFYRFLGALYLLGRLTLCDIIFPFVFVFNLSPAYLLIFLYSNISMFYGFEMIIKGLHHYRVVEKLASRDMI